MEINNAMDELVRIRQEKCNHNYQDRVVTANKVFCGKCGKAEKVI